MGAGSQIARFRWEPDGLDTGGGECFTKGFRKQRVPIVEQETLADQEAIDGIGQLATALDHPGAVGLGGDPGDVDREPRASIQLSPGDHEVPAQSFRQRRSVQFLKDAGYFCSNPHTAVP